MKPLWVVQNNLGCQDDIEAIRTSAEQTGADSLGIKVIPFLHELPADIPFDRPVLFYGSARWTTMIARSQKWCPGVFHDDDVLNVEAYAKNWGHLMVNDDAVVMRLSQVADLDRQPLDEIFIRPVLDDKSFAGEVMRFEDACEWIEKLVSMEDSILTSHTLVAVSTYKRIFGEWRCFVAQGQCITASQYRAHDRLRLSADVPEEVTKFAEDAWKKWPLLPIVAIDIARLEDRLAIMEAGSINATGFYAASIPAVVASATSIATNTFLQKRS